MNLAAESPEATVLRMIMLYDWYNANGQVRGNQSRLNRSKHMSTSGIYRGIVHGSIIELQSSPGVPDGMEVEVFIKQRDLDAGERSKKLLALFGSCKGDAEDLDAYMAWNDRQQKRNRTEQTP